MKQVMLFKEIKKAHALDVNLIYISTDEVLWFSEF